MSQPAARVILYGALVVVGLLATAVLVSLRGRWRRVGLRRRARWLGSGGAFVAATASALLLLPLSTAVIDWRDTHIFWHTRECGLESQLGLLRHPRWNVRAEAARSLGWRLPVDDRVITALAETAARDSHEDVRAAALLGLAEMGPRAAAAAAGMAQAVLRSSPAHRAADLHALRKVAPDAITLYLHLMRVGPPDLRDRIAGDLEFAAMVGDYGRTAAEMRSYLAREIQAGDPARLREAASRWSSGESGRHD